MGKLDGKTVIVTGASSGIGEATSLILAGEGAGVVLAARRANRLEALKSRIESAGGRAIAVTTDVDSDADRKELVARSLELNGEIYGLVNNAGYGQRGPVELLPVDRIRRNFETNFFSLIALSQLVIPEMRRRGRGRIVHVGSVAGRIARPFSTSYDATKHALEATTDGMRGELAPFGIEVVLIQPGFILTEFVEVANQVSRPVVENAGPYAPFFKGFGKSHERLKRIAGTPEDVGRVVLEALTARRPRFRYAVPGHAKLLLAMKRWLPDRLFEWWKIRQMGLTRKQIEADPVED